MKLVINRCFGGFSLPEDFCDEYGFQPYDDIGRSDPDLVAWVENHPGEKHGFSKLVVITIPETYTDYCIEEYDGCEKVIYVVDGKLCFS